LRKALLALVVFALALVPVALATMQEDTPAPTIEITGVNPTEYPTIYVSANVLDSLGQPVPGLTAADFAAISTPADLVQIISVRSVADENLPVSVVLAIDVSSSMAGVPFENAKLAARTFINTIGPDDPVAIITFGSTVRLVQDYTSDKNTLLSAIDSLFYGGQTALYEGALTAVQKAAESPTTRRAVILLSDGAQYQTGVSQPSAPRGEAVNQALIRGVPVYTIGLGFGIDRSYLQELSNNTFARFEESPTPERLEEIYTALANLLRSQYEIALNVNAPADGTLIDLLLRVTTPQGTTETQSTLRTPVPIPVVRPPTIDSPVETLTEARAEILADDGIASVAINLDGENQLTLTEEPYTYIIDPLVLSPGPHTLEYVATDGNGDVGSASVDFEVAALPSTVTFVPELPSETISEPQTFTITITGQTPPTSVDFNFEGVEELTPETYVFTIDPFTIEPGPRTLEVTVLNEGGVTTTEKRDITVADLPPRFVVTGLQDGQVVSEPVDVAVDVLSSQSPLTAISFSITDESRVGINFAGADNSFTLEPATLQPGPATLTVTVSNEIGQSSSSDITFEVAALPPELSITGLSAGETVEENRQIDVTAESQTTVNSLTFLLDNDEVAHFDSLPATFDLDAISVEPGSHILSLVAANEGGQSATIDIPFIMGEGPSLTATAMVTPSDTPSPTPTATPTASPTATLVPTLAADVTGTAVAMVAAQSTADSQATQEGQATAAAVELRETVNAAVSQAQATAFVQATVNVEQAATLDAQATQSAVDQATQIAQATVTAEIQATEQADARATINVEATSVVETVQAVLTATQSAADQQATLDAQATLDVQATANASATAAAQEMEALLATANAQATATSDAEQQANAQATLDTRATLDAQAALEAQATLNAQSTATQSALDLQATRDAQATLDAQAALEAQATLNAQSTATQSALDLQATRDAQATADAQASATADAQEQADAQATINAQMTTTAEAQRTADAGAQLTATANAQATIDAEALLAADTEVVTEEVTQVQPTESATEEPTEVAQLPDASATATTESIERTPVSTVTPIGTLIPAQAETTPESNSISSIIVIIVVAAIILILIFLILSRARRRDNR
jgi:VWFA-related protein